MSHFFVSGQEGITLMGRQLSHIRDLTTWQVCITKKLKEKVFTYILEYTCGVVIISITLLIRVEEYEYTKTFLCGNPILYTSTSNTK